MGFPRAVLFDLLTALLDSWTTWNAAAGSEPRGRAWRAEYLRMTYGFAGSSLFLRPDPQRGGGAVIGIARNVIVSVAGYVTSPRGSIVGDLRSADASAGTSGVT